MKRTTEPRGVLLPESLRQGLDRLINLIARGGSPAERDQTLASLQGAFLNAVRKGLITSAQERLFAARLRDICGPAGAEVAQQVMPIWRQATTDEIVIN